MGIKLSIINRIKQNPFVERLLRRPVLFNVATNTGWLFVDKVIKIIVGLLVGAWVTRYLGPARYGDYSYAIAFVSMFFPLSNLGLSSIVIRELVNYPDRKNELLGTSAAAQFIASFIAYVLSLVIAYLIKPDIDRFIVLVAIFSGMMIFQAWSNTIVMWFQSQVQAKYLVWARSIAIILVSVIRIGLILSKASLEAFFWVLLIEVIIISSLLTYFYLKEGGQISLWKVKFDQLKSLLRDSWPLIISAASSLIYKRIDRLMLGDLIGDSELGIYSAAVQLSELWFFIPTAIGASIFPIIVRSLLVQTGRDSNKRMQLFMDILSLLSYSIIIITVLIAPWLVVVLFGNDFLGSGKILQVHIWTLLFLSVGIGQNQWLVAKNLVKFAMLTTIVGAIVNICLNYWLIPLYGGVGAAWASVITYAIIVNLLPIISIQIKDLRNIQVNAYLAPVRILPISKSIMEVIQKK